MTRDEGDDGDDDDEKVDNEELKGVVEAISQISRCHSLSLSIPPEMLRSFRHSSIQCQHLKRLRITPNKGWIDQPVPFFNSEVGPEEIEIRGVSFQSLQISWNHLSSAKIEWCCLEDIVQLFQHALQMTYCHIHSPILVQILPPDYPSKIENLDLAWSILDAGVILIRSLTLPCLQEFGTDQMALLTSLPALVERSSCPLTRITLLVVVLKEILPDGLRSLPGVTDLVVESPIVQHVPLEKLLLEEYFPDLSRLTLRLQPFLLLWRADTVFKLLRKWPWAGGSNENRKILVIDSDRADDFSSLVWETDIGECLNLCNGTSR
jgi:hypothetical protein